VKQLRIALSTGLLAASLVLTTARVTAAAPSAGWNDWSCKPSSAHSNPVVLLHGLGASEDDWSELAPYLVGAGFCVFTLTYGQVSESGLFETGGVGPMHESAQEIARFADQVRAATGAAKVDLVGHSEGGLHALYIPKVLGRTREIGKVVTMGTDANGFGPVQTTELLTVLGLRELTEAVIEGFDCQGCTDILPGSEFRLALTDGRVSQPGIAYTLIFTRLDEAALAFAPLGRPFLMEPGVRNLFVQDRCALDLVGHAMLPFSRSVASMVANALDPRQPIRCGLSLPL
jgi:triacylglycerol esterase/lipase EstA (alpha/beta hydrolase family)